jgi:hypothetical protein
MPTLRVRRWSGCARCRCWQEREHRRARFVVPTVATCVDLVVHLGIDGDGRRRVRVIVGVPGRAEGDVTKTEAVFIEREDARFFHHACSHDPCRHKKCVYGPGDFSGVAGRQRRRECPTLCWMRVGVYIDAYNL